MSGAAAVETIKENRQGKNNESGQVLGPPGSQFGGKYQAFHHSSVVNIQVYSGE